MVSIHTDTPARGRPWMNWLIVLANVLVLAAQAQDRFLMPRFQLDAHAPAVSHFLTYAFLHLGWLHLATNMLVLLILGGPVNDRLGHLGYLAFYLSAAVVSGIGFVMLNDKAVVGA